MSFDVIFIVFLFLYSIGITNYALRAQNKVVYENLPQLGQDFWVIDSNFNVAKMFVKEITIRYGHGEMGWQTYAFVEADTGGSYSLSNVFYSERDALNARNEKLVAKIK